MKSVLSAALLVCLGAAAVSGQGQKAAPASQAQPATAKVPDRGKAYYHYVLAHMYEEMAVQYNRQEYFTRAIEEYKLAMQQDPGSAFLSAELADLYAHTGRIRDAVLEAEEVLKRDPNNIESRRLLGRIFLRIIGDPQGGRMQSDMVRRAIEQYEKIIELDARDVEAHLTLGRLYKINNDLLKAEAVLKKALQLQPESEEVLTTLAFLYTDTSQFNAAVQLLEKVTAKSANPRIFFALGNAYEQSREYEKAIQAFRRALDLDKDNPEYIRSLGQNLLVTEQYDEALRQYKALIALEPQDGNAYLRLGQIYRQMNNYDLAMENLKKAGSLMQDSLEVPYNIALLHESQGRTEEAIQIIRKLLEQTAKPDGQYSARERGNRAIFLERLGTIYRQSERYPEAIDSFRKMMEGADQENSVRGITHMVETYRQSRELPKALAEIEAGIKRFPEERSLKLLHASIVGESGQPERATAELRAMLQNKPEDRELLITIAQINERAKRYAEAEQAVAAAEKLSTRKEEKEFVYFLWGSILERQKKYDAAEEQFRKVLATNPNSAMALNYLGYMLADRGVRLEEARKYIQQAVDQEPHNGAYLDSMGWVYYKLNRMELAEQFLLKAVQRVPRDATIRDHLGDVYYRTGRIRDASIEWQKALAEMQKSTSENEPEEIARLQKKLEDAKVRLAKETGQKN